MTFKTGLLAVSLLALTACASTPDPEPAPMPAPKAERPAPVPVMPAPIAPVTQEPFDAVREVYQGPPPGTAEDFLYQSGGDARIYFAYNQYDLSNQARDTLRRQAQWLNIYSQVTAVVEGNADERGTREYNLALGARRADSVKAFLVSQGVAPSRLTTVSYGKERPIDGRSSEEGWARNRNGHTNLMTGTVG